MATPSYRKANAGSCSGGAECAQSLWACRTSRRCSARISRALTRFANNTIHQNVAEQDRWISVRVALDHRTARATTNRFDPDSIRGRRLAGPRAGPVRRAQSGFVAAQRAFGDFGNQALRSRHRQRNARASRKGRRRSHPHRRKRGTDGGRNLLHRPKRGSDLQLARRGRLARRNHGAVFDHRDGRR